MESDYIQKKISEAEKVIKEKFEEGVIKRLNEKEAKEIHLFYNERSLRRLETAKIIFKSSIDYPKHSDFSEVVSAAYYSMYYIVHSFLAKKYQIKIKEGTYGMHALTINLILYYLIKTNLLAKNIYEEYCDTLRDTAEFQDLNLREFQAEAYEYIRRYQQQRDNRERFTYFISENAETHHAQRALNIAHEFINKIRELMLS